MTERHLQDMEDLADLLENEDYQEDQEYVKYRDLLIEIGIEEEENEIK